MSRQYISGNATSAKVLGVSLHTAATGASWTLEHADTKAIGSGAVANPAWDGTISAVGDSYGKVIYKMPVPTQAEQDAGISTQWLVQFELVATGGTTPKGVYCRITTAKTHVSGILADAGTVITTANNSNADGLVAQGFHVNADRHRLALVVNGDYGYALAAERQRTLGGAKRDALVIAAISRNSTWVGMTKGSNGAAIVRDAAFGEYGEEEFGIIGKSTYNGIVKAESLAANGNQSGLPVGPLVNSGGIAGVLESFVIMPSGDTSPGATQNIRFGESVYAYKALSVADTGFCPNWGTFCVAGTTQVS